MSQDSKPPSSEGRKYHIAMEYINKTITDNTHFISVLTDEERHERRIASAALYKSYLNRSGPKHLGSKEIPEVG